MQTIIPTTGNTEPDGTGAAFVQFTAGKADPIDASGLINITDVAHPTDVVYGQIRFIDGAPRGEVVQLLRAAADFFARAR